MELRIEDECKLFEWIELDYIRDYFLFCHDRFQSQVSKAAPRQLTYQVLRSYEASVKIFFCFVFMQFCFVFMQIIFAFIHLKFENRTANLECVVLKNCFRFDFEFEAKKKEIA